jgi:hypothetical protein
MPTEEEAEAELEAAKEEPLKEDRIDAMLKAAVSEELAPYAPEPDLSWLGEMNDTLIDQELLVLNRNRGDGDEEVDSLLEQQRREALGDDEQHTGSEEPDGQEARRKAPGDGDRTG